MKKIFTTFALAAFAMTSFAQSPKYQQYFRVEFNVPIVNDGSGKTSVAAMGDDYTYCNPDHNIVVNGQNHGYIDIQAGGNLNCYGTVGNFTFRPQTNNITESSAFFFENGRYGQDNAKANWNYQLESGSWGIVINNITAYSLPVEKVSLIDSTATHDYTFIGDNKTYKVSEFTFNRLPRNVAELKTLLEDENGNRVEACNNPLFIGAVVYLVLPRLLDCSYDCRDMINYLYGVQYTQLHTTGIGNGDFQNLCIGKFQIEKSGYNQHNNLFQHFAGATPGNQYKPNGKGYGYDNGPYKVRIGWDTASPLIWSGDLNANVAKLILFPNPDATDKGDISFETASPHTVTLRPTKKNGWFVWSEIKSYYSIGKQQRDDDF
jgi:hypothetical protein